MIDFSSFSLADVLPFIAIGFAAQIVDGALGMAFGLISSTLLISIGVPPAIASARVHVAECFTTAASGISHILHRNVDWKLLARIAIPGVIGGVLGAYVLTNVPAETARPFVLAYLALVAVYLLWRSLRHVHVERAPKIVEPLGLAGGFLDAAGGGGWGPIVTSNLLVQGAHPRKVVGTVNTAEFFLTLSISLSFLFNLGIGSLGAPTIGLLAGGLLAAPLGARVVRHVPARGLLVMVGIVLIATSLYGIYRAIA
ncbi:sulfite exporter TauE/SafE family protein [Allosphingosinicella flava]|uniref:Probable membrane transporter protein n=1 Tax=Allosphingosinicella flava TaxID=2771430 RepID=A0A7T2LND0_9SPHN|nr:sulfite exporter TauE/SafE family protein [Sphingosinicella flava]QPQ56258.1 sulfite exporter TauE/SafE family protein [Sphingosinicella flava]